MLDTVRYIPAAHAFDHNLVSPFKLTFDLVSVHIASFVPVTHGEDPSHNRLTISQAMGTLSQNLI